MTPETATSWLDVLNAGGIVGVMTAFVVYGLWLMPKFLKRWEAHTEALTKIAERLGVIERELDIKNP